MAKQPGQWAEAVRMDRGAERMGVSERWEHVATVVERRGGNRVRRAVGG